MTRAKHRAHSPPPCGVAIYDGRDILASATQFRTGGLWHAHDANRVCLGAFPSREQALGFIQAHVNRLAAVPLDRERQADLDHVHRIQRHQQQAKAYRARRSGTR